MKKRGVNEQRNDEQYKLTVRYSITQCDYLVKAIS